MSSERQFFAGNERFPIVRRLGAGGMGVVYEVLDRQRGQRAALKTLKELSPEALYRFKQEFRCLADLSHPNLISFYELFSSGDEWFFTMELVDGVNLQESLAPPALGGKTTTESGEETETNVTSGLVTVVPDGPSEASPAAAAADMARPTMQCDPDRLRALLCQLAEGLNALHAGGILHRDLKPANVMVTRDNRVVILDFGISQSLIGGEDGQKESGVAGTADFMSPEQAMGGVLTEASDWYAFGVILFHALTGIMPFPGATSRDRLQEKRRGEALRPSEVCGQIPADLDELCAALLRKDPGKRLSGVEVLRTLGSSSALEAGRPAQQAVFVGRAIEQARMREALALAESGPVLLCVRGKSGLGKSALVHKFLEEAAESSGTVVLSGRCYEQESVPFKALDSLMDGLGRFMRRLSRLEAADLMPRDAGALAQMFPVLANVPAIANAPRRKTEGLDIVTVRKRAGLALRELFSRIRDRRRLVIAIDDLHWGDVDSATLIEQLMEPPDPPPLLLLCSYRSGQEESSQFLQLLQQSCAHCRRVDIDLNPLTAAEVLELSRLMDSSSTIAPGKAEAIARECGGNVFFVREVLGDPQLEKDASGSLDSMIWNRTQRLPAKTRRLLELVAVSGRPIPLWLALRAADLEDEGFAAYTALRGMRLLRRSGAAEPEIVETYHDRVRETLVARLDPGALRENYGNLVRAIEASGSADPEQFALYLEGCGETEKAGRQYALAAQRAQDAFAFDRAAQLFRRALELSRLGQDERRILQTRYGESLANAGRAKEAAEQFDRAAEGAAGSTLRELRQKAAYYYCISGQVDQGKGAFRKLASEQGIRWPDSNGQAIGLMLAAQARMWFSGFRYRERPREPANAAERERADLCWSVAIGIGAVDMLTAACFSSRGVNASLRTGDPYRVARSLCWETAYAATVDLKRAAKLLDAAEPMAKKLAKPYIDGLFTLAQAVYRMNESNWKEAIGLFDKAEDIWLEHCTGVEWELATARHFGYWALNHCGEFPEAGRRVRARRKEAEERGNLYVATSIGVYPEPYVLLTEDRPEEADRLRLGSLEKWTRGYSVQHCLSGLTGTEILLYAGREMEAWRYSQEQTALMEKAQMHRMPLVRAAAEMRVLSSALLAKDQAGPEAVAMARKLERKLSADPLPWARAFATGARACLAIHDRDNATAMKHLESQSAQTESMGLLAYPAVARRAMGFLTGGERGKGWIAEGEAALGKLGVVNPGKTAILHLPWRPDRE